MAVPKKKQSKARRDKRSAHHALTPPKVISCPQCSEPSLPHHVCPHCGYYNKEAVIKMD